jgi:CDP-diacylglycerol--serine O-phosphatidyltransferase
LKPFKEYINSIAKKLAAGNATKHTHRPVLKTLLTKITIADLFTLMNGVFGFLAIMYIIDKLFFAASLLICGGMVMDSLDGMLAHRFGSQRTIGRYLDSISDSITFCMAPAVMLYGIFYNPPQRLAWFSMQNALVLLAAAIFAVCGLLRLARFIGKHSTEPMFLGLPTPAAALGMIVFCNLFGGGMTHGLSLMYQPAVPIGLAAVLAMVMISNFPYPKLMVCMIYLMSAIVAVCMLALLLASLYWYSLFPMVKQVLTWFVLGLFLFYLLGGPVYEKIRRSKNKLL